MLRLLGAVLAWGIAVALSFPAIAAAPNRSALAEAQKRYQEERALCLSGKSAQDQKTCLREAGAALQDARRGRLEDAPLAALEQNKFARCQSLKGQDRELCVRRMQGEGTVRGSVEGGGIYRELVVTVPAEEPPGGAAPGSRSRAGAGCCAQ